MYELQYGWGNLYILTKNMYEEHPPWQSLDTQEQVMFDIWWHL